MKIENIFDISNLDELIARVWIDLKRNEEVFTIRVGNWFASQSLALCHDWRPTGTKLNSEHLRWRLSAGPGDSEPVRSKAEIDRIVTESEAEHSGSYFSSFDYVTAEDAANLAAALERALETKSPGELPKREFLSFEKEILDWNLDPTKLYNTQRGREYLKKLITFLKGGTFYIA